jgi:hypothetical protein
MAKEPDPFELSAAAKQTMDQAYGAVDQYFEFLKKNVGSFPTGGTDWGEKWKGYAEKNIGATQEFVKQLSKANSFEQIMRVQMEFMQSQATAFGEQLKTLGDTFAKSAPDTAKK